MLENVKNFVTEKIDEVEDFCEDHFYSITVATIVGFCSTMAVIYNRNCKNVSNHFKDLN